MTSFSNKTDLEKKNVKTLRSYSRYFDVKPPYKIIVGPYFCQTVAEKRISLQDGIQSVFLQRDCELFTTRCCINELQQLVDRKQAKFIRGAHILRTLKQLPCLHKHKKTNTKRWVCVDAIHCLQFYVNKGDHCFALQPRSFLGRVRSKSGIPSIWIYQSAIVMDKLSKASLKFIENNKNLNQTQIQQKIQINRFVNDDDSQSDEAHDADVSYDVVKELQLDDKQNTDDDYDDDDDINVTQKQLKFKSKTNTKRAKHNKEIRHGKKQKGTDTKSMPNKHNTKHFHTQNRIRYGPDGGFDTMGMKSPSRKKRRTRRGHKKNDTKNEDTTRQVLNDNSFETINDDRSKPQKTMSTWWKN